MNELIRAVCDHGANGACVITTDRIVLSAEFRAICEGNGCGRYGRSWNCPPHIGDIEKLMQTVGTYSHGILYQTIGTLEDSFDFEGMMDAGRHHCEVAQAIHTNVLPLLPGSPLHLGSGGCYLCERCAILDQVPCRYPDRVTPPMEGYGIHVSKTCESTPLKYINGQNTVTYFGLILYNP